VPVTPDRNAGTREEEELLLDDRTADGNPTDERAVRYVAGRFVFRDTDGVYSLRADSISDGQHKALRHLVHLAEEGGPFEGFASGAFQETLPASNPFPTSIIWWESAAKLKKIVEETITYNANKTISIDEWKVYDVDGVTILVTATDTITYSGVFELSRTRVLT